MDAREFIRPNTLMVYRLAVQLGVNGRSRERYLERCWGYVVHKIKYPPGSQFVQDWHVMHAYPGHRNTPLVRYEVHDYWNLPSETIRDRIGDCDDKSILLTSLLRRRYSSSEVYCTVGRVAGYGHMWVSLRTDKGWVAYETTKVQPAVYETGLYEPSFRFNDLSVIAKRGLRIPDLHPRR